VGNSEKKLKAINIICILACIAVVTPLLIIGHYDYPSADDWAFGVSTYHCIQEGGSPWDILRASIDTVMLWREQEGEPRYMNAFLGTIQPGIWGVHFYRITPWIMIGSLFLSEILLCRFLLGGAINKGYILPVILPSLAIQIFCAPFPTETFYWWTGAVNYTFIFSLSVILLMVFLMLKKGNMSRTKTVLLIFLGVILGIAVGGDSYAASLSAVCFLAALSGKMLFQDKRAFLRTFPITATTTAGLLFCLIAPGNAIRLEQDFRGARTGAVQAILLSLWKTMTNIYSWTGLKMAVMLLLTAPFLWRALKRTEYRFRYPAVFTLFTFGIYASQIVATMYVNGSTGGGRMGDVLYYAYHVWLLLNAAYWIGWLQRRDKFLQLKAVAALHRWLSGHIMTWFMSAGIVLTLVLGVMEVRTAATVRACAWLRNGYAQEYARAWEERLKILEDDTIREAYFDPLPGLNGEMVFYADFQPGENWLNDACADYYRKDAVGLK